MSDDDVEEDVDDGEAAESDEEGGGKRISGAKIALFAGLPLLLIIGGIAGAFFTGLLDPLLGSESTDEEHEASPLATNIHLGLTQITTIVFV